MTAAWVSMQQAPFGCVVAPRAVAAGTRICDIVAPATPGAMVRVGGRWLLRRDWGRGLAAGELLEVHVVPAGGESGNKQAIGLVLTIASFALLGPGSAFATAVGPTASFIATIAANFAINTLLSVDPPKAEAADAAPSYTTSLAGNRAALDEAIPVGYGYQKIYPRFACEPYVRYDNDTSDQYYHALLCIGMGQYQIDATLLDDTVIEHFNTVDTEVVEYAVLAPGAAPTIVQGNVVTAPEVSGQALLAGRHVGGFVACNADQQAEEIEIDIAFESGLGDATDGTPFAAVEVEFRVQVREIDAWGVALEVWQTVGTESVNEATASRVRRTYTYTLASAARVEVRVVRMTPYLDNPLIRNDATWTGLRAVLAQDSPLAAGATHIEIRMRASETLNALSQRRFAVLARRKLRAWSPGGGWASPAVSRSIAWALADKWSSTEYGDGLPDSRIDLQGLYELDQTWSDRQDHLDLLWDAATDSESADQTMARAGRARCVWRNSVRTVMRDEPQALPVTAYTSRDLLPGTARIAYNTHAAMVPDAIVVEYLDYRSWDWASIVCPAPGVDVEDVVRPEYMRLPGVIGPHQAEREGLYEAAARSLRRIYVSGDTELQGLLPAFGSAVIWAPALRGYGAAGDVVAYDAATLTATLSEPPTWTPAGTRYITLQRPDGSVTDAIEVTAGAGNDVVLDEAPDFTPDVDDPTRERTRYTFGTLTEHRRIARVLSIRPQALRDDGATIISIAAVLEDDTVHEVDADLLPGEEEIQDPIDSPNEEVAPDDADDYIVRLLTVTLDFGGVGYTGPWDCTMTLEPDGTLSFGGSGESMVLTVQPNQWLLGSPFASDPGDLFEVRASAVGADPTPDGTLDTWQALSTARSWEFGATPVGDGTAGEKVRIKIRNASTLAELANEVIEMRWTYITPP